ncbi:hypothetical protein HOY82DRAFT_221398 [Tuber indicum]|nr:hypothetical protein HOY82DRAFT_221398 [Tuber indicum]
MVRLGCVRWCTTHSRARSIFLLSPAVVSPATIHQRSQTPPNDNFLLILYHLFSVLLSSNQLILFCYVIGLHLVKLLGFWGLSHRHRPFSQRTPTLAIPSHRICFQRSPIIDPAHLLADPRKWCLLSLSFLILLFRPNPTQPDVNPTTPHAPSHP